MYSQQIIKATGNKGMTLIPNSKSDGNKYSLPNIGFDFYYNGTNIRDKISIISDSAILFNDREILKINRRDTSTNEIYYQIEEQNGYFKIRFQGNCHYNQWGMNNLLWEVYFFNGSNTIMLIIEKIDGEKGENTFLNTNGSILSYNALTGKSFVFMPINKNKGMNYIIKEGSFSCDEFLIKENNFKYIINNDLADTGEATPSGKLFNVKGMHNILDYNSDINSKISNNKFNVQMYSREVK